MSFDISNMKYHIKLKEFKNIPQIEDESIFFKINYKNDNFQNKDNESIIVNEKISISKLNKGKNFNPYLINNEKFFAIAWGCPLINNKENHNELINIISRGEIKKIKGVDGQFLVLFISKDTNIVTLVSDRFNGINLFYSQIGETLYGSSSYYLLASELKKIGNFKWSDEIIYDVIRMNRVFGNSTYDVLSKFLSPATLINYDFKELKEQKYWKPNFQKCLYKNDKYAANKYIKTLSKSISSLIENKKKEVILYLSGGHDSRSILSLIKRKIKCFTLGYSENREVLIAKKCSNLMNQEFYPFKMKIGLTQFLKVL